MQTGFGGRIHEPTIGCYEASSSCSLLLLLCTIIVTFCYRGSVTYHEGIIIGLPILPPKLDDEDGDG